MNTNPRPCPVPLTPSPPTTVPPLPLGCPLYLPSPPTTPFAPPPPPKKRAPAGRGWLPASVCHGSRPSWLWAGWDLAPARPGCRIRYLDTGLSGALLQQLVWHVPGPGRVSPPQEGQWATPKHKPSSCPLASTRGVQRQPIQTQTQTQTLHCSCLILTHVQRRFGGLGRKRQKNPKRKKKNKCKHTW